MIRITSPTRSGQPEIGLQERLVRRHRQGEYEEKTDTLAEECPVALVFNGISHAVMMATPTHLDVFAVGFALSEGIVSHAQDIFDLDVVFHADSVEVQLTIAQPAFLEMKQQRRALAGRTGCGVCGIESLELLDLQPEQVEVRASVLAIDNTTLARIIQALPAHQPLMQATGCAHAAAWCNARGDILQTFEDVGRHNALDKLIGWLALQEVDPGAGFVFMTSRASYELIRKIARRNIATLATLSAPTTLAVKLAHEAGIRLLSFCKIQSFVEY